MKFKQYVDEMFANRANSPIKSIDVNGIKVKCKAITRKANLMGWSCLVRLMEKSIKYLY